MNKKFIAPLCTAIAGAALGVCIIGNDIPQKTYADEPVYTAPEEIPSGCYYIDGDPSNDLLYLVVDGKTIHYASATDLREGFKAAERAYNPRYLEDEEGLDHQTDVTMADWADDSYTYKTKFAGLDPSIRFEVMWRISESPDGTLWDGQGMTFFPDIKGLRSWEGTYILYEDPAAETEEVEDSPEVIGEENAAIISDELTSNDI